MAERAFLVQAEQGDYDEYRSWPVRIYESEEDANAERDRLTGIADSANEAHNKAHERYNNAVAKGPGAVDDAAFDKLFKATQRICKRVNNEDEGTRGGSWTRPIYNVIELTFCRALSVRRSPNEDQP